MRKLYRSRHGMLAGVCSGLGEFFQLDPNIVRLLWVILSLGGSGVLLYLVAWIILPEEPRP